MSRRTDFTLPLLLLCLGTLVPSDAHAYLDPGTGSLMLQALLAALFAGAFTLKMYWRRFKALVGLGEPPERLEGDSASASEQSGES